MLVDESATPVTLYIQFTRPIKLLHSMVIIMQTLEEPEEEVEERERQRWSKMEEEDEENERGYAAFLLFSFHVFFCLWKLGLNASYENRLQKSERTTHRMKVICQTSNQMQNAPFGVSSDLQLQVTLKQTSILICQVVSRVFQPRTFYNFTLKAFNNR
jgi:hypothetical protein